MPNLKTAMGDSTLHSVSVVAVVSERQGTLTPTLTLTLILTLIVTLNLTVYLA